MYPIIFGWGKVKIYTHGLMIASGAVLGGALIFYLARKKQLQFKFLFDTLVYSFFAGIIGARIFYIILYYYQFDNWKEMFYLWQGGLVSFGGIIFGFLTAGLILKKHHQNILRWFDLGLAGLFLGWAVGRIGCLLSGDIPGMFSASKIALWGQIPVALFESIWTFLLSLLLTYLLVKKEELISRFGDGFLFWGGLWAYFVGRLVIDFFRDERIFWIFRSSQIGSLIFIFVISVILYLYYFRPLIIKGRS